MIRIIGELGSSEYRAAEKMKDAFLSLIPDHENRKDDIRIVVSAKTYGEQRQDIDLIVVGHLKRPIKIPLSDVVKKEAQLLSFFFTVEVKDHPPKDLVFIGPKVHVRYKERLADASEQAEQQKYSAINYIKKNNVVPPFIVSILLLNNLPSVLLPQVRHNILGGDFSGHDLLQILYIAYERGLSYERKLIEAFRQKHSSNYSAVASIFTHPLVATALDKKKIALLTRREFNQQYAQELGTKLLIFKGPGGTGKTVTLLQLAHYAFREHGKRALILTYNVSLVADIRRLLALMDMTDDIATPTISISTVHSFLYYLLCDLHLFTKGDDGFIERYSELKEKLLKIVGEVDPLFLPTWDFVLVDESQDWPDDERRILYKLFGAKNVVVADGQAQMIRGSQRCDWTADESLPNDKITLSKCLRLKHDITVFASRLIDELGIVNWRMNPNVSVYGGRVLLVIGDMLQKEDLISDLISRAKTDGNSEVDLLFCVPPSMVQYQDAPTGSEQKDKLKRKGSTVAQRLTSMGYKVWDAVNEDLRHNYPVDVEQLRVVQYDSCRGLEGWTVVNFAIEELYDYKKQSHKTSDSDLFLSKEEAAEQFARNWLAIPLTRAIDTLVINVKNPHHPLLQQIRTAAAECQCVEIIDLT